MRAVVVYESMYGNTRAIADAIGDGLRECAHVEVVPVRDADAAVARGAELLVVGGPTHVRGMSRAGTRSAAVEAANKAESGLTVDPAAEGPGVREWLDSLGKFDLRAAAFDTRLDAPVAFTGRASKRIARKLRQHGFSLVTEPESFLVTKATDLNPDEQARAHRWGKSLALHLAPSTPGVSASNEAGPRR